MRRRIRLKRKVIRSLVIVLSCLLIFIVIIHLINRKGNIDSFKDSDKLVYNKNKSFLKKHKVTGIVFKNIKCTYDGNNSLLSYTIVNKTSKKINLYNYEIIVKDKNKKTLTKIDFSYNNSLLPNKEIEISNSVVDTDLSDAHYMNLKLNTKNKKK